MLAVVATDLRASKRAAMMRADLPAVRAAEWDPAAARLDPQATLLDPQATLLDPQATRPDGMPFEPPLQPKARETALPQAGRKPWWPSWKVVAMAAGAIFVLTIGGIVAIEAVTGTALSAGSNGTDSRIIPGLGAPDNGTSSPTPSTSTTGRSSSPVASTSTSQEPSSAPSTGTPSTPAPSPTTGQPTSTPGPSGSVQPSAQATPNGTVQPTG